ncbi:hypothetical protein BN946_scf185013.g147 [Trametes cinnabarina]|uniref:Major facilitator superfamily (MFS) profile domain-containing protein n=1 Tax=Pycnoporus cinnabarinus TaxID=5643 RepID=A0A060SG67_PYCCI|nr:hypothetical protein BN946_scf185013.g147 [Trametes cinnabarina]
MTPASLRTRSRLVGQPLLYAISVFASLGVFLFGYDQGVMSGVITGPYFRKFFNEPTAIEVGTMVAVLEIGAFVTSVAAGRVGDTLGRRGTLFSGAVVFAIGGAIQTFTLGFWTMVVGRIISGLGVGLLSTIVPIYQSEISPPNHRGALACMEFTGNIFGYASSVWIDYFCSFIESDLSWRIPLFIQCVIGAILALGSLAMPESPRWLIDVDRDEEGMRVIADLHGGDPEDLIAKAEFQEIKDRVIYERESGEGRTYAVMWKRYKKRVLLAMSSQAFAQLRECLKYPEAGWVGRDAILMTGINAIIYILSTLPPWYLVDRWGRRVILLSGGVVMALSLGLTGWWMYIDVPETPRAVVFCVIVFNAAFGYSWGPIPWYVRVITDVRLVADRILVSEKGSTRRRYVYGHIAKEQRSDYRRQILPLSVRAKGVSLSTATNWLFNFIVGEMTPELQELIEWRLYPMHGFFCVCSVILVYFLYPETKGVPLEEMDAVFGEVPGSTVLACARTPQEREDDENVRSPRPSRRVARSASRSVVVEPSARRSREH